MTTLAPPRSLEQRMQALEKANATRMYRARLKQELREAGTEAALDRVERIVCDPPAELRTMRVLELLKACPGIGQAKINRILNRVQTGHSKTLGGMTRRQRAELADVIVVRPWREGGQWSA